jgi:hypothetical protein
MMVKIYRVKFTMGHMFISFERGWNETIAFRGSIILREALWTHRRIPPCSPQDTSAVLSYPCKYCIR